MGFNETLRFMFPVLIITDTGWRYAKTARPNRGLHDYEREITFTRELTVAEQSSFEELMRKQDNPGYCWWTFKRIGPSTYRMTTTMDSSD